MCISFLGLPYKVQQAERIKTNVFFHSFWHKKSKIRVFRSLERSSLEWCNPVTLALLESETGEWQVGTQSGQLSLTIKSKKLFSLSTWASFSVLKKINKTVWKRVSFLASSMFWGLLAWLVCQCNSNIYFSFTWPLSAWLSFSLFPFVESIAIVFQIHPNPVWSYLNYKDTVFNIVTFWGLKWTRILVEHYSTCYLTCLFISSYILSRNLSLIDNTGSCIYLTVFLDL